MFKNEQIIIEDLPHVEEVEWSPLNRKYLRASLISTSIFALLIPLIFLVVNWINHIIDNKLTVLIILGIWFFIMTLVVVLTIIGFNYKAFALREHDLLYKSGYLFRKTTALPFNRIQHSEINQGVIERMYGLSRLEVFTAGGAQSDLSIPGLLSEDAQKIKAYIMKKTTINED